VHESRRSFGNFGAWPGLPGFGGAGFARRTHGEIIIGEIIALHGGYDRDPMTKAVALQSRCRRLSLLRACGEMIRLSVGIEHIDVILADVKPMAPWDIAGVRPRLNMLGRSAIRHQRSV
jgi:hypothetical protein